MIGAVNNLSSEQFSEGLSLLGSVYGHSHAVFTNETVKNIWFKYFSNYTRERWIKVIEYYVSQSSWFPKAPHEIQKLWDESGEQERLAQQKLAALPPAQEEDFDPEQLIENQRKIKLVMKLMVLAKDVKLPPLNQTSSYELEAMLEGVKKAQSVKQAVAILQKNGELKASPEAFFDDIRAYFFSGSERYRQMAIGWASEPNSGCELVHNARGQIVDIKKKDQEVEF
ncbi:MAG: hypothetical protein ACKPCP_06020 [Sphaerospermopsis kisseleviana]